MKLKRLLACLLVLVMAIPGTAFAVGTTTANQGTVTFSDIKSHWAKTYIEEMATAGLFKGYDDGTFCPENELTAAEALSLCARVAENTYRLTDKITAAMSAAHSKDLNELMNGEDTWFYDACSVCLEVGILDWSDLQSLVTANSLGKPLAKEWLSVYLVRAMGMEKAAEALSGGVLNYADAKDVDADCVRQVCLLNEYGIVKGDEDNNFSPKLSVTRAVCATMLSRVLDYADSVGIYAEVSPEYTNYTYTVGVIKDLADTGFNGAWQLALADPTTKDKTTNVSVDGNAAVYCDGIASGTVSGLRIGDYVRVCQDGTDVVVRMIASENLTTVSGTITALTEGSVTITPEGGVARTYEMNGYTAVVTPDSVGGVEIIRQDAGYTAATCLTDADGNVLNMNLSGGTYMEYGLLSSVSTKSDGSYVLGVAGFDGAVQELTAASNAAVLVNGLSGSLKDSYVGRYVVLYREYKDDSVTKISIDSVNTYIQGVVKTVAASTTPFSVSVTNLVTGKVTTYQVPSATPTYYSDTSITVPKITTGSYITARVSGTDSLDWISTWPGSVETAGTLTGIEYGYPTTTLKVTDAGGVVHSFKLDMSDAPTFKRNNAASTISAMITGDQVVVTVQYNEVTLVVSTPQAANLTGVVETNTLTLEGSVISLKLTDGSTASYTITDSTSITQNGSIVSRTSIQPGSTVAMVVINGKVASVEVTTAGASTSKLEGTVYLLDKTAKQITLLVTDSLGVSSPVVVSVPSAAKVLDESGNILELSNIKIGSALEIRGSYTGQTFVATIVVILGR